LAKWSRNIKENQIQNALFAKSQFIKEGLKFKETEEKFFAVWLVMEFHAEKKSRVWFVVK